MKRFADRLREARIASGMTQEQLGFALDVTKSSVSAWENGRDTPSFRVLPELRRALGCSLDDLIYGPSAQVREAGSPGFVGDKAAQSDDEHSLLVRFRGMSTRRRKALLELMRPQEDS